MGYFFDAGGCFWWAVIRFLSGIYPLFIRMLGVIYG